MYIKLEDKLHIVPLINFNIYLCNGKSEIKVTINNSSEKLKKKNLQLSVNYLQQNVL
jgi:hypothetical protein